MLSQQITHILSQYITHMSNVRMHWKVSGRSGVRVVFNALALSNSDFSWLHLTSSAMVNTHHLVAVQRNQNTKHKRTERAVPGLKEQLRCLTVFISLHYQCYWHTLATLVNYVGKLLSPKTLIIIFVYPLR